MNTNNSFLQAIKILIKESINGAPYNRTKQAMIVSNNGDNTYDIRFDGKLYTNIISYPNTRSLPLKHIVKVIIPNNQASQMYISAEGSPLIYYPVGSYYETSDATFDPNTAWGGTWSLEAEGLVHIGAGSNYTLGDTGGNKDAIIPYHNHKGVNGLYFVTENYDTAGGIGEIRVTAATSGSNYVPRNTSSSVDFAAKQSTAYAGTSGNSNNANMQPYVVVNRWHRTA